MGKTIDLTGMVFGDLTVIETAPAPNPSNRHTYWKCKCSCGNDYIVVGTSLRNHTATRCKQCSAKAGANKLKLKYDITGNRYGKLTVLKRLEETDKSHGSIYLCQCDCGNITKVTRGHLVDYHTQSCGKCNNRSKGELKIENILKENNFSFTKEQTFDDLILPSGTKARFDFYVNNQYLIEFDGQQHFEVTGGSWFTEEYVEKIKQYDNIKNQYCKDNNIPLIRIPYTHYDNLCIDDLKLETTTFLI